MASFYSNENFPLDTVEHLRRMGHDVLTTKDVGKSDLSIPDPEVLQFAADSKRCLITLNRRDFMYLHQKNKDHSGIIVCKTDYDFLHQAECIDKQVKACKNLAGELLKIYKGD